MSGARVQYLVLVPHGVVYRSVTLAVSAARGSGWYTRAKNARDSVPGSLECSILFRRPEQGVRYDRAREQYFDSVPPGVVHRYFTHAVIALGEVYGMSSTLETRRLACTSAVSRFSAARGNIPIFDARSYRRLGKCTVCHRVQYLVLMTHGAVYRYVRTPLLKCTMGHRHLGWDVWRAQVQYLVLVPHGAVYRYVRTQLSKCTVCHRRLGRDVWRARVQHLVLVPHGAVYRSVTLAVSAARGRDW